MFGRGRGKKFENPLAPPPPPPGPPDSPPPPSGPPDSPPSTPGSEPLSAGPVKCAYCNVGHEEYATGNQCNQFNELIKCVTCNRYFCNRPVVDKKGVARGRLSHLMVHLVRSKHDDIQPLWHDGSLRCSSQRCISNFHTDPWLLYYFTPYENDSLMLVTNMRCMTCAIIEGRFKHRNQLWKPIFDGVSNLRVVFARSTEENLAADVKRNLTLEYLLDKEREFEESPGAANQKMVKTLAKAKLRYGDYGEYFSTMKGLSEAFYLSTCEELALGGLSWSNVEVSFEENVPSEARGNGFDDGAPEDVYHVRAKFTLAEASKEQIALAAENVSAGTPVRFRTGPEGKYQLVGHVEHCPNGIGGEIVVRLRTISQIDPTYKKGPFKVEFENESQTFKRQLDALSSIKAIGENATFRLPVLDAVILGEDLSSPLYEKTTESWFQVPGAKQLNQEQEEALRNSAKYAVTATVGPPGTGKTQLAVAVVYNKVHQKPKPVLVVAQTNVTVQTLAERLIDANLNVTDATDGHGHGRHAEIGL